MGKKKSPTPVEPAKEKGKKKQGGVAEPVKEKTKKRDKSTEPTEESGTLKPQRGLAIGDNFGWTGKLPATLLFEFCQKQKWNRVNIEMHKTSKGFIGCADLSWENPKTKEIIHIKMKPDTETLPPRETTNEARHFAATYAMHRINYVKNLRMVLPVIFRDYWTELEKKRQALLKTSKKEHDRIYNANPFQVYLEEQAARAKAAKEREARINNEAKTKTAAAPILMGSIQGKLGNLFSSGTTESGNSRNKGQAGNKEQAGNKGMHPFSRKAWENAPFLDIPAETRTQLEAQIRSHITWTKDGYSDKSKEETQRRLVEMGFRVARVQEALLYTHTLTDALEWLLFHIPEDDLPPFFERGKDDNDVSVKVTTDIAGESFLQRLSVSGCDKNLIREVASEYPGDFRAAAVALTWKLVAFEPEGDIESTEDFLYEMDTIEMIGSNKVSGESDTRDIYTVSLNVRGLKPGLLLVRLFRSEGYPYTLPGVQMVVNSEAVKVANYIKVAIVRQVLGHVIEEGLLGHGFLLTIVEWLEENIPRIIDDPGALGQPVEPAKKSEMADNTAKSEKARDVRSRRTRVLLQKDMEMLENAYKERLSSPAHKESLKRRAELPAWKKREDLIHTINSNKVTLITGETGSGKSTQVVQFILDDLSSRGQFATSLMCTQPRRISTIGLAERISDERTGSVGDEVGYIIRGENKTKRTTRLSFVTTGVLLRMLQGFLSDGDTSVLDTVEYFFVDEVHERSVDGDFLLIVLKKIMGLFPRMKIVLMSATINTAVFERFFRVPVNHIHIEGRTFPIRDVYLDEILRDLDYTVTNSAGDIIRPNADAHFFKTGTANYDLLAKLAAHVDNTLTAQNNLGSVLIFLPGVLEINKCIASINSEFRARDVRCWCLPLHSTLALKEQKLVFRGAPAETRKIVVSTNIAETSITIPDCVAVIDGGRGKKVHFDAQANSTRLVEEWCSQAEMKQRRGRSGRIQQGTCYHMYTKGTEQSVPEQPEPEIKRVNLDQLYLTVKAMGIDDVAEFLNSGLDPPHTASIKKARDLLGEMGALQIDESLERLTHLGSYLSLIPTGLQSGKLLILGCIFGCVEMALTLAALGSAGLPFINSRDLGDEVRQAKERLGMLQGDVIAGALAYHRYIELPSGERNGFLKKNHLSYMTMQEISSVRSQYLQIVKDINFVPLNYTRDDVVLNINNNNFLVLRAIITGAFSTQLARVKHPSVKYVKTFSGAMELPPDQRRVTFWIRNETTRSTGDSTGGSANPTNSGSSGSSGPAGSGDTSPARFASLHPSSVAFVSSSSGPQVPDKEYYLNEVGGYDQAVERALKGGIWGANVHTIGKCDFVVYNSSNFTSKLYLRDVTPTTTVVALLFGGDITYDVSSYATVGRHCPGIVLDRWQPVRTWCKNAVLIKRLRILLDQVIEHKLNPNVASNSSDDAVLQVVQQVIA